MNPIIFIIVTAALWFTLLKFSIDKKEETVRVPS
jgi:hypothetical protein